uniref:Olfactory receptor n=1 Tax=Geotrypetes seraphini TaxID=260995 RepID=A0A6P8PA28_GEOSA|nr:olfactory receptor 1509-like [Geotrypetes seraphini]XP_033780674.1 olfactory receptor 1509-like [Geotrypetes seraphini]
MAMSNETSITQFILLGLSSNSDLQTVIFVQFFVMYLLALVGNLLIIITIYVDSHLHSPMYFLLSNLSFIDLSFATVTVPKFLVSFLMQNKTISFSDCLAQIFFLHLMGAAECFHLSLMAYDRYVAICNPLRYTIIMNRQACLQLVASIWVAGFIHGLVQALPSTQLPFCGPNQIDHFFCDVLPISLLACSNTDIIEMLALINSGLLSLICFLVVSISYTYIISTVLKIRSSEGRKKTFSTCASHLLVVTLFFGPVLFIYMRPSVKFTGDKMVSVFYAIVTPVLNPCIYTLRNKKVKSAMKRLGGRKVSLLETQKN